MGYLARLPQDRRDRVDEAGFTPRQVADQRGHANPSVTLVVYFGRHVVSAAAAEVLYR